MRELWSWAPVIKIRVKYRTLGIDMLRIYIAMSNAQHLTEHASVNLPFIGYITTRRRESGKIISGK